MRERGHGSHGARVHLVLHHVLQFLVVGGPEEDVGLERLPRDARGDELLAAVVVPTLHQSRADVLSVNYSNKYIS